jgi:predicted Zn-dependent peptidase
MVQKLTLKNGFTVLLHPVDSVVSASIGLWVKAGARHETEKQHGYAHFIEHMLFKGTPRFSAKELARQVDRVGGQHNAATNREFTCYYINVESDHIELSLDIIGDMYYNSLFDAVEIEKEKGVIVEEIRMYEDASDEHIHDIFMETMLVNHPLGRQILGTEKSITGLNREMIMDFYDTHYYNENCILSIAGKFDPAVVLPLIEKYFAGNRTKKTLSSAESSPFERVYRKHVKRDIEQVHFCLGFDGFNKHNPDRWGMYLLSTILGGSMSSRLFQKVRENEGLCYSVYSFHSSYRDLGIFGVYCGTSPEKYSRALELIVEECRELLSNGITEEELADAKTFMKGNLALSFESIEVRMGQFARDEICYGRQFDFEDVVKTINAVTIEDMARVAETIFRGKKAVHVSIGDLKKPYNKDIIL